MEEDAMFTSRPRVVGPLLAAAAAVLFAAATAVAANDGSGAFKLEGAWIAKVQGAPFQWSYVLSPDASGRRASLHGSVDIAFAGPIPADRGTPLIGESVMTGRDTGKFNSMWYGISNSSTPQIAYIGVSSGEIMFVDQGKMVVTHHFYFYLPSADADGDGIPDPGAVPVIPPVVVVSIDTRLPSP
jgi:hypothetical protein